jgi:hypothetical protein
LIDPTAGAVEILRRTQPWVRLASLVNLLLAALMVVFSLDAAGGGMSSQQLEKLPFLLLYALMAFVFFVQAVYLHKYARGIDVFVAQGHQVHLEAALEAQRRFWRFAGAFLLLAFLLLTLAAGLAFV